RSRLWFNPLANRHRRAGGRWMQPAGASFSGTRPWCILRSPVRRRRTSRTGEPCMRTDMPFDQHRTSTGLVDVLDRVLDKGLLIAGDIRVSLAEVELLTIRIRLIVCSIDKAQEIGMDWWRTDPHFSGASQ